MGDKKEKINKMDVILVIVAVLLIAFTVYMIKLYRETGAIPETLCTCVFGVLGGECGVMAWIKTTKERHKDREWQREDQEREDKKQEQQRREQHETDTEFFDQQPML